MKTPVTLLLLALLCAGSSAETDPEKSGDSFEVKGKTLLITSFSGIGTIEIAAQEIDLSRIEHIRFRYGNGHGLTRLEGIKLATDLLSAQGQGPTADGLPVQTPDGAKQNFTIPIYGSEDGLEASVPEEFLRNAKLLEIHWVDFYR